MSFHSPCLWPILSPADGAADIPRVPAPAPQHSATPPGTAASTPAASGQQLPPWAQHRSQQQQMAQLLEQRKAREGAEGPSGRQQEQQEGTEGEGVEGAGKGGKKEDGKQARLAPFAVTVSTLESWVVALC